MKMQTYEQRILIPDEGKWLYNEATKEILDKAYLAIEADATEWVEITAEQKQELEALWEKETEEE